MKKQILILFLSIFFFSTACYRKEKKIGADVYADTLIGMQSSMIVQLDSFFQSLYYPGYDAAGYYWKAVKKNSECMDFIQGIGDYKEDERLYSASMDFYNTLDHILAHQGKKLLEVYEIKDAYGNYEWKNNIDTLLRQSVFRVTEKQLAFDSVLTVFLDDYGFDVEMDTNSIPSFVKETETNE